MQRADGVGDSFLVNHHDRLGMNSDKILMRHADPLAARQLQRERMKAILQPASDLLDDHAGNLSFHARESIPSGSR